MNKRKINLIVLLITCIVLFSVTETAFRIREYYKDKDILSRKTLEHINLADYPVVRLGHIIRLSGDDRIIYELKPDISVRMFVNTMFRVTTNSAGYRDDEYALEKPGGTVRIIGIGDSFMFGLGVSDRADYMSMLEQSLNASYPSVRWDVINTAVPGYNTAMEVETLKVKAMKYHPDLVIVGYYYNDLSLPNFIRNKSDYFTLRKSFFIAYLAQSLGVIKETDNSELVNAPDKTGKRSGNPPFEDDPDRVPSMYRDMVGWNGVTSSLKELKALSDEHGFEVVVFLLSEDRGEYDNKIKEFCSGLGFNVIDAYPDILAYLLENNIETVKKSDLVIKPYDPHPSAKGHRFAADVLVKNMASRGIIKRLIEKQSSSQLTPKKGAT